MKKILCIILTAGLLGCNNHLDKSIFEPLSAEELKKSIERDSLFKYTYGYIQHIKDSVLKDNPEKVKFLGLTYKRVHEFNKFNWDTIYFKPIEERIEKEWDEKYGKYQVKLDSISNYWKNYKNENTLEQYVKVELVELDKEYYSDSDEMRKVNLGFQLTPLKGQVDQVRFGFKMEVKIGRIEELGMHESLLDLPFYTSWYSTTTPFSIPVDIYWEAGDIHEELLAKNTIETLFRDYTIHIEIDQISKDGKNRSKEDLNIPESLTRHWEYEKHEVLKNLFAKDVIKEILGEDYIDKEEYRNQERGKILKDKDSLVREFYMLEYNLLKVEFHF